MRKSPRVVGNTKGSHTRGRTGTKHSRHAHKTQALRRHARRAERSEARREYSSEETIVTQKEKVYKALQKAAERIGLAEYRAGRYRPSTRREKVVAGYSISSAHKEVLDAMDDLIRDRITPEQAMAVLHGYDVMKARLQ